MPEKWVLRQYQALPLNAKVHMSQARIREWHDHYDGDVIISFSGGKDSTVLAHVVHDLYPKVPLVFVNTGLEYPEIQAFAKKMGAEFIRPKMRFDEVISKFGYPIISKENAEAIHYARKIRNGGGMVQKQERGMNSQESEDPELLRKFIEGGRNSQTESGHHGNTGTMGFVTKEEQDGEERLLQGNNSHRIKIPQPIRMRIQFNGKYGGVRTGVVNNTEEPG